MRFEVLMSMVTQLFHLELKYIKLLIKLIKLVKHLIKFTFNKQ